MRKHPAQAALLFLLELARKASDPAVVGEAEQHIAALAETEAE